MPYTKKGMAKAKAPVKKSGKKMFKPCRVCPTPASCKRMGRCRITGKQ